MRLWRSSDDLRGKNVLIMGLGLHGGGVGAANFFLSRGSIVVITDLKTEDELKPSLDKLKSSSMRKFFIIACSRCGHQTGS